MMVSGSRQQPMVHCPPVPHLRLATDPLEMPRDGFLRQPLEGQLVNVLNYNERQETVHESV